VIAVSSLDDPRVAIYRAVANPSQLEAEGLFVVEGRLVVPRLLAASAQPGRWAGAAQSVLLSPAAFEQMRDELPDDTIVPVYVVPQPVMDGLVGYNMHRGCLAVARRPAVQDLDAATADARRLVVLESVNNPDNIGGIFRSAAAFGADLVVLGPACADPLYRKSVRTSMGATLDVPFTTAAAHWPAALDRLRAQDCEVVALTTNATALPLPRFEARTGRLALLAGAEGKGLTVEAIARASTEVTIPTTGRVDSLNVATAISIALYYVSVSNRR
jgi:tRNA G18 (ribose-2'-O)-methylase SpoU